MINPLADGPEHCVYIEICADYKRLSDKTRERTCDSERLERIIENNWCDSAKSF